MDVRGLAYQLSVGNRLQLTVTVTWNRSMSLISEDVTANLFTVHRLSVLGRFKNVI